MSTVMVTTGQIARDTGEPRARVNYAIEKVGIREHARAGIIRLFSSNQIPAIKAAIATIRVRKQNDA